jgi:hypothetical protein
MQHTTHRKDDDLPAIVLADSFMFKESRRARFNLGFPEQLLLRPESGIKWDVDDSSDISPWWKTIHSHDEREHDYPPVGGKRRESEPRSQNLSRDHIFL